jgi:Domain of unknown function (DUF303).
MIKLPAVFSNGALFESGTSFELPGFATPDSPVTAVLTRKGELTGIKYQTQSDSIGRFRLKLTAPSASFDSYDLTVSDPDGETAVTDILFGELWIASGQSNMEMTNIFMRDRAELYKQMAGKKIRIFAQDWLGGLPMEGPFPLEPQNDLAGAWINTDDTAKLDNVSACASAAVTELYDRLNTGAQNVPVGFLNVSVGATAIETWLPKESVMDSGEVEKFIGKIGRLPVEGTYNTHGWLNFTQPCALYNLKIAPLDGLRTRGTLWYQGESNVGSRESGNYYLAAMRAYHAAYAKRFAPDGGEFHMLCSQLFPWFYSEDECTFGYLNQAFTDAADAEPDKFGIATVYDLPPIWAFGQLNHPIHPTNKYDIGRRLGMLAYNRCHGGKGLRTAVTFKSAKRSGDKLTVRFNSGKNKLTCTEKEIRGVYIAGENGLYIEANAEIKQGALVLSHPYLPKPIHAAYMASCMDLSGRLYCGGLPVAPFITDRENCVCVEPKPWTHTDLDSVFVVKYIDPADFTKNDAYPFPTWLCGAGAQICRDKVFSRTLGALRIYAAGDGTAEVYVPSYPANRLDMYNYTGLTFNIIGNKSVKIKVGFEYSETDIETLWFDAASENTPDPDGDNFNVAFKLPEKRCSKIIFKFDYTGCAIKAVSMEKIVLIPKS